MIGETVGSYQILSKLSIGGMGTVYRAEHTLIGKPAAVKVLHPELSTNRDIVNRFFNEAKATTTIKHPGIVDVIDFGYMSSGHAYLIMEFLEGMSLARRLSTHGKMTEGEAAMLLRSVCSALSAAHAKGIVHRDLKPDNIFLTPDPESAVGERPKILDFGIAKLTDIGLAGSATKTGAVMGTPTYMSPEQCRGTGNVDARADLYSIGCIYYELVTGQPPFTEEGAGELIGAHLYVDPPSPVTIEPQLSPDTVALIMALLAKKPDQRPQTAKELAQRLTVLAQKLGWITAASPAGVTGPSLDALPMRPPERPSAPSDATNATLPSTPPGAAPYSFTPAPSPSQGEIAPLDKPTTLSGAASSMHDVPRRSRAGLGIAMAAAVLLVGGTVAFFKLDEERPATTAKPIQPAATPIETPAPIESTPAVVAPVEVAAPVEPVEPKPTTVDPPSDPVTATKPADIKKPVRKPPRRDPKKHPPKPVVKPIKKPDPSKDLIERDL